MSNHSGSYMLNNVLEMLEKQSIFDYLGKEKTRSLVHDIVNMSSLVSGLLLNDINKIAIYYPSTV